MNWILVYFMLCCISINCAGSQECSETSNGSVIITEGVHIRGYKLGRISICDGREWRAVCGEDWDTNDARVVCRQLGFSIQEVKACGDSCFGKNESLNGATNFHCSGNETRLSSCQYKLIKKLLDGIFSRSKCDQYAGVVCTNLTTLQSQCLNDTTQSTRICPSTTTQGSSETDAAAITCPPCDSSAHNFMTSEGTVSTTQTTTAVTVTKSNLMQGDINTTASAKSCLASDATISALGVVLALLLLILVGVVTGWVRSCHIMQTSKESLQSNIQTTLATQPSVQYSSLGPQGTPIGHTSPQGKEERIYHVLEQPETDHENKEKDEVYHEKEELGLAYEVPIQTTSKDESVGEKEY